MPVFEDPATEASTFLIMLVFAVPSFIFLACIMEECSAVKTRHTFEDLPIFGPLGSSSDVFGPANASLICFFFVAVVLFGFAITSALSYMAFRGDVMSSGSFPSAQLLQVQAPANVSAGVGGGTVGSLVQEAARSLAVVASAQRVEAWTSLLTKAVGTMWRGAPHAQSPTKEPSPTKSTPDREPIPAASSSPPLPELPRAPPPLPRLAHDGPAAVAQAKVTAPSDGTIAERRMDDVASRVAQQSASVASLSAPKPTRAGSRRVRGVHAPLVRSAPEDDDAVAEADDVEMRPVGDPLAVSEADDTQVVYKTHREMHKTKR